MAKPSAEKCMPSIDAPTLSDGYNQKNIPRVDSAPVDLSNCGMIRFLAVAFLALFVSTSTLAQDLPVSQHSKSDRIDGPVGFYLHMGGAHQRGLTHRRYSRVAFSKADFNTGGGKLVGNRWVSPAVGILQASVSVYWIENAADTGPLPDGAPIFLVKIIKNSPGVCNGADFCAHAGSAILGSPGFASSHASCAKPVAVNDTLEVCAFGTSRNRKDDLVLDGSHAHTFFSGVVIR